MKKNILRTLNATLFFLFASCVNQVFSQHDVELLVSPVCYESDGGAEIVIHNGEALFTIIWYKEVIEGVDLDGNPYTHLKKIKETNELSQGESIDELNEGKYKVEVLDNDCEKVEFEFEVERLENSVEVHYVEPCNEKSGAIEVELEGEVYPADITYTKISLGGERSLIEELTCSSANCNTTLEVLAEEEDYYINIQISKQGCKPAIKNIKVSRSPIKIEALEIRNTCQDDGEIIVDIVGGEKPYVYQWRDASGKGVSTSKDLTSAEKGVYSLTVTDDNDCSNTAKFEISSDDEFIVARDYAIPSANRDACGDIEGSIRVKVISELGYSTNEYSFDWESDVNVNSEGTHVRGPSGIYQVTVTSPTGCSQEIDFHINEYSFDILLKSVNLPDNCLNQLGDLIVAPSNPNKSYDWEWSNQSTGQNLIGIVPGDYALTATDEDGCISQNVFTLPEVNLEVSTIRSGFDCIDKGYIELEIIDGLAPYDIEWSNGSNSLEILNLEAGSYTVSIVDDAGCEYIKTFSIENTRDLIVLDEINHVKGSSCDIYNGNIRISSLSNNSLEYLWEKDNAFFSNNEDLSSLGVGRYKLTATDGHCVQNLIVDICCCHDPIECGNTSNFMSVQADVNSANRYINLNVFGGIGTQKTYDWSGPNGFASRQKDINDLEYGEYVVRITDGCENEITKTYHIVDPSVCEHANIIINGTTACINDPNPGAIALEVTGSNEPFTYDWDNNTTLSTLTTFLPNTYWVTVTDQLGCTAESFFKLKVGENLLINSVIRNRSEDCETKVDPESELVIRRGNAPYQISFLGKIQEGRIGYPLHDGLPGDKKFYSHFRVVDNCGLEAISERTVRCDYLCDNSRVKFGVSGPGCFDECTGIDFLGDCTKVVAHSTANDNNIREMSWPLGESGDCIFEGRTHIDGLLKQSPRHEWAGSKVHYSVKNKTTGCRTTKSFTLPERCIHFKFGKWLSKIFFKDDPCDDCDNDENLDSDGDGILDGEDNCINNSNPNQADEDCDGIGDVCDDESACFDCAANIGGDCYVVVWCCDKWQESRLVNCGDSEYNNLERCPFALTGGDPSGDNEFGCNDKLIAMAPLRLVDKSFYYQRKGVAGDSILGELLGIDGTRFRNISLPYSTNDRIHKVIPGRTSTILVESQLNQSIKISFFDKLNDFIRSEILEKTSFVEHDPLDFNAFTVVREERLIRVSVNDVDQTIDLNEVKNAFDLNSIYDARNGVEVYLNKLQNELEIINNDVVKTLSFSSAFNPKKINVRNDSTIVCIGDLNGILELDGRIINSNGRSVILFLSVTPNGEITNIMTEELTGDQLLTHVSYYKENILYSYLSSSAPGGVLETCSKFNGVTFCSNKNRAIELPYLNGDTLNCDLSWSYGDSGDVTLHLQKLEDDTWSFVEAIAPQGELFLMSNGFYRIEANNGICPPVFSNTVLIDCSSDCLICTDCNECPNCPDCVSVCEDCTDCSNCPWCPDCVDECTECNDCSQCPDCPDCNNDCETCTDCSLCPDCPDCLVDCQACTNCIDCPDCPDCIDCNECTDCSQCPSCPDCEEHCNSCTDCNLCPECPDCEAICTTCQDCSQCPWCIDCDPNNCMQLLDFELDMSPGAGVANIVLHLPINSEIRVSLFENTSLGWVLYSSQIFGPDGPGLVNITYGVDGLEGKDLKMVFECVSCLDCPPIEHLFNTSQNRSSRANRGHAHLNWKVYPNPSSNSFTIEINAESEDLGEVTVVRANGGKVYSDRLHLVPGRNRYYIPGSKSWQSGVYYLVYASKHHTRIKRLIKID